MLRSVPQVKSLRRLKQVKGFPTNPGPYSPFWTTPKDDRMGDKDWRKIFDDYDDRAIKPGYPYTDIYGAKEIVGKCPYCKSPMPLHMTKQLIYCPYCRRQLVVEAPNSEYPSDTHGQELSYNTPPRGEWQFDPMKYPQQAPGTSRDDSY